MEVVHVYTRQRHEFGREPRFSDRPAELLVDIPPSKSLEANWIERNPTDISVQAVPEMSEHEVNTELKEMKTTGILHTEGGWPKDVDPTEAELVIRYKRKVEKDEDYIRSVKTLGDLMDHQVRQNNSLDIYEEYFSDVTQDHSSEPPSAKTVAVFRDPNAVKRSATAISWHPDGARKTAVAYSVMQFQKMPDGIATDSYIWDVDNPNVPDQTLSPSSPLCTIAYNKKDSHLLVGGSYNGLISFWDTRKGASPVDVSLIERSHRDPVYGVQWIQSKTGTECFSVSTDGQVFWWDTRKLGEPTDSMVLEYKDPSSNGKPIMLGGCSLDFETSMPTKFMVGTEQGIIFNANRKAKKGDRVLNTYRGHHGPINALQRNPFFPKYFLTVGDWTARMWMEDLRTPIMTTKYHMSYLTDGCWSPTRPGVFYTTKMDGTVDVWDYLFKQNDPTLTLQVSDTALQSLAIHDSGKLVATGSVDGSCTLMTMGDGLATMQPNEKAAIGQMLERETKREKNLDARLKEMRLKERKRAETPATERPESVTPAFLTKLEKEFFDSIQKAERDLASADSSNLAAAAGPGSHKLVGASPMVAAGGRGD